MTGLLILTLLAISMACAFYGTSLLIWTIAMAAAIVVFGATGSVPLIGLAAIGIIFAAIAIPLNVKEWRRQLISAPFLKDGAGGAGDCGSPVPREGPSAQEDLWCRCPKPPDTPKGRLAPACERSSCHKGRR